MTESRRDTQRWTRTIVGTALVALVSGTILASPATAATPSPAVAPLNSTITITTDGWGHGRGMSQYGAWAAAKQGLTYQKILSFYYPGTTLASKSNGTMRVWITADTDNRLNVKPASGLRVKDSAGTALTLPTGSTYVQWRISRSGSKRVLAYQNAKGAWTTYKTKLSPTKVWTFSNTSSKKVTLVLPNGTTKTYRGEIAFRFSGTKNALSVNAVGMEDYLKSVVPSEMPASWASEALKAQSVAARSYAARYKANLGGKKTYDICDTTSCQVYKGASTETAASSAAVSATSGKTLWYGGNAVWAEFSSSNGGYSVKGSFPYQVAQADPYDASMRQYWALPFTATAIQKKYPTIGTFSSITVNSRDGKGPWGGRVTSLTLKGSAKSVTVSGTSFKSTMGLRETLMQITGGLATGTANYQRWQSLGGSPGTLLGPPAASETTVAGGLVAPFDSGTLYWSKATGSKRLSGAVLTAYQAAGGPGGTLGFPTSDVGAIGQQLVDSIKTGTQATFAAGLISCPTNAKAAGDCVVSFG